MHIAECVVSCYYNDVATLATKGWWWRMTNVDNCLFIDGTEYIWWIKIGNGVGRVTATLRPAAAAAAAVATGPRVKEKHT